MLKLYWANFTTAQLHHLTRKYPDFLSENVFHQHDMIKDGLQSVILKDYGTNMNVSKIKADGHY